MEAPVPRPLARLRGTLADLLLDPDLAAHEGAWVQATLTDDSRPLQAMERLRERFPHTLVLGFEPASGVRTGVPVARVQGRTDHEIALDFLDAVRGTPGHRRGVRAAAGRLRRLLRGHRRRRPGLRPGRGAMRLHSLEITAFGPFAETVEVDFDALSEAGLFLLAGPTGAGKTSVLDAICFALYGDVPGDRNTARRLRCDQAAPGLAPRGGPGGHAVGGGGSGSSAPPPGSGPRSAAPAPPPSRRR